MYWYDRRGERLVTARPGTELYDEQMNFVERLLGDYDYKVVKQEYTPKKKYWASTVWLGLNANYGEGKPLIFETMVFGGKRNKWFIQNGKRFYYRPDYEQLRYSTEEQALRGHQKLVEIYARKEAANDSSGEETKDN